MKSFIFGTCNRLRILIEIYFIPGWEKYFQFYNSNLQFMKPIVFEGALNEFSSVFFILLLLFLIQYLP